MARSYRFGSFELDSAGGELRHDGVAIPLEPKTFDLLLYLVQHHDQAISVTDLLRAIWPDTVVGRGSVHRSIRLLRRALAGVAETSGAEEIVETVRQRGYRFCLPVQELGESRRTSAGSHDYVGRRDLRDTLGAKLDRALEGNVELVFLHGPAGIGKSATLVELARDAERAGAMVLAGRSVEGPASPPYRPWSRILRASIERDGPERVMRELGRGLEDVVRAIPELSGVLGVSVTSRDRVDPVARYRVHDAMCEWLRGCCRRTPLVLLLDDLNRADLDSIQLLGFLAGRFTQERLLIVVTYRDGGDLDSGREALNRIAALHPGAEVQMAELTAEEIGEFVHHQIDEVWSEAELERLADASGGNPLFVEQLLRSNWVSEPSTAATPRKGMSSERSAGLRGALRRLLGDASEDCAKMLAFASIFGREFSPTALAAGFERPLFDIQKVVDEAFGLRILEVGDDEFEVRFVHGLIPEILSGQLSPGERGEMHHRAVVGILATRDGPDDRLAELAYHASQASNVSGIAQAFEFGVAAAADAVSRLAYEESVTLFERALALRGEGAPQRQARAACLIELGHVLVMRGAAEDALPRFLEAFELAKHCQDPILLAKAALGPAEVEDYNQLDGTLAAALEEALEQLGDLDPELRVQLLIAFSATGYYGDRDRMISATAEALAIARAMENGSVLCASLLARSEALGWTNLDSERLAHIEEAYEMAGRGSIQPIVHGRAIQLTAARRLEAGDRRGFRNCLGQLQRVATEHRLSYFEWSIASVRGAQAMLEGRFADGRSLVEKQIELGARSNPELSMQVAGMQHILIESALLLEHGADPLAVTRRGETPRSYAAKCRKGESWEPGMPGLAPLFVQQASVGVPPGSETRSPAAQ